MIGSRSRGWPQSYEFSTSDFSTTSAANLCDYASEGSLCGVRPYRALELRSKMKTGLLYAGNFQAFSARREYDSPLLSISPYRNEHETRQLVSPHPAQIVCIWNPLRAESGRLGPFCGNTGSLAHLFRISPSKSKN